MTKSRAISFVIYIFICWLYAISTLRDDVGIYKTQILFLFFATADFSFSWLYKKYKASSKEYVVSLRGVLDKTTLLKRNWNTGICFIAGIISIYSLRLGYDSSLEFYARFMFFFLNFSVFLFSVSSCFLAIKWIIRTKTGEVLLQAFCLGVIAVIFFSFYPPKVVDPKDSRFNPDKFDFSDYTNERELKFVFSSLFPVGTKKEFVDLVLLETNEAIKCGLDTLAVPYKNTTYKATLSPFEIGWNRYIGWTRLSYYHHRPHFYHERRYEFIYDQNDEVVNIYTFGADLYPDQISYGEFIKKMRAAVKTENVNLKGVRHNFPSIYVPLFPTKNSCSYY